jgi:hypothetical protein
MEKTLTKLAHITTELDRFGYSENAEEIRGLIKEATGGNNPIGNAISRMNQWLDKKIGDGTDNLNRLSQYGRHLIHRINSDPHIDRDPQLKAAVRELIEEYIARANALHRSNTAGPTRSQKELYDELDKVQPVQPKAPEKPAVETSSPESASASSEAERADVQASLSKASWTVRTAQAYMRLEWLEKAVQHTINSANYIMEGSMVSPQGVANLLEPLKKVQELLRGYSQKHEVPEKASTAFAGVPDEARALYLRIGKKYGREAMQKKMSELIEFRRPDGTMYRGPRQSAEFQAQVLREFVMYTKNRS